MSSTNKLFTPNFIFISLSSFLMFIAFYLLMPVIAMYLIDEFGSDETTAGIVVASYIVTSLLTRPFSGYLVDKYDHRVFYIFTLGLFTLLLGGYLISSSIGSLVVTRVLLGACFAMVTTGGSTLIIDVMPSARRAEGIGYFGAVIVLSMAIGPMLGLYLLEAFSYTGLFVVAMLSSLVGFICVLFVKTEPRERVVHREKLSFDRFLLTKGLSIAAVISLLYFMYGSLMAYVSLYIRESGQEISSGNFFLLFGAGVIVSRIFTGKHLNRGRHFAVLQLGLLLTIIAALVFVFLLSPISFIISSVVLGIGFGTSAPAIQTMIIDLVPHNRRGTANSTYFIALDIGSGTGMLFGGIIASAYSYQAVFIVGLALTVIAAVYFNLYARGDYRRRLANFRAESK